MSPINVLEGIYINWEGEVHIPDVGASLKALHSKLDKMEKLLGESAVKIDKLTSEVKSLKDSAASKAATNPKAQAQPQQQGSSSKGKAKKQKQKA